MKYTAYLPLLMAIESAIGSAVFFYAGQPLKGVYWFASTVICVVWMWL
jgi:hypothetical protein